MTKKTMGPETATCTRCEALEAELAEANATIAELRAMLLREPAPKTDDEHLAQICEALNELGGGRIKASVVKSIDQIREEHLRRLAAAINDDDDGGE